MNTSIAITALVSAAITWVFMYLDSRLFDTPKTKFTYIKGMSFVAILSATIVYFMGTPVKMTGQAGGQVLAPPVHGTTLVHGANQEIFSGLPPF